MKRHWCPFLLSSLSHLFARSSYPSQLPSVKWTFSPKIPRCNSSWFFLTMPDAVIVIAFFFVLFFLFSSCSWWICIFHLFGDVFIRSGKKGKQKRWARGKRALNKHGQLPNVTYKMKIRNHDSSLFDSENICSRAKVCCGKYWKAKKTKQTRTSIKCSEPNPLSKRSSIQSSFIFPRNEGILVLNQHWALGEDFISFLFRQCRVSFRATLLNWQN